MVSFWVNMRYPYIILHSIAAQKVINGVGIGVIFASLKMVNLRVLFSVLLIGWIPLSAVQRLRGQFSICM